VIVTGRNLGRIYLNCTRARLEWTRTADRCFTHGEPVKLEEERS
jgi:hypothetical protein